MQYYMSIIIFPFFSIRYLNAVKYTRRLSTEYPPELRRVPGLIESTVTRKFVSDHSGVGWGGEFSKVIQTRDIVEGLHNQGSAIWRLNANF